MVLSLIDLGTMNDLRNLYFKGGVMDKITVEVIKVCLFEGSLLCLYGEGIVEINLLPGERERSSELVGRTVTFTGQWAYKNASMNAVTWKVENE